MSRPVLATLFLFALSLTSALSCDSNASECLSWWRWDTPDGCRERGCCSDGIVSCRFPVPAVPIRRVHVVQGCHFDAGFVAPITDILNKWFHQFFPLALAVGQELDANQTAGAPRLHFTAQSWIVALFLNCPAEYEARGLVCPSLDEVAAFKLAVSKGYITWHAFPFNGEAEVFSSDLFDFGFKLTHHLDDLLGVPRKKVMSQRDVPGLTKAAIPTMRENGVVALSLGTNGGSAPANVPKAFIWRFNSTTTVRAFWLGGGYSGFPTAPHIFAVTQVGDEAMVVLWRGDNAGPPLTASAVERDWITLRQQFPDSEIVASSFDGFVEAVANVSDDFFPVVDAEIGDTWIYGIASDPTKVRDMRVLQRMRSECVASGQCDVLDARFFNFSVMALKNGEHTWGRDQKVALGSYVHSNWTNSEFAQIQTTQQFRDYAGSWSLQYNMGITDAVSALRDHPLATALRKELSAVAEPVIVDTKGWSPVAARASVKLSQTHSIVLDANGRVSSFAISGHSSINGSFADLTYSTYGDADYRAFAKDYNYGYPYTIDTYDFLKVNLPPCAAHVDEKVAFSGGFLGPSTVVLNYEPSHSLVTDAGAPSLFQVLIWAKSDDSFGVTVVVNNKSATRLPESTSVSFAPSQRCKWSMAKLGGVELDPSHVQTGGSKHLHAVDSVSCGSLFVEAVDSPLVSFGFLSAFPTPIDASSGSGIASASFILHNNLWNTNYIMWFPYKAQQDMAFRFTVTLQ